MVTGYAVLVETLLTAFSYFVLFGFSSSKIKKETREGHVSEIP